MLVRAAKPNFDALCEAAKNLLIWSFNRKQKFHSTFQNDYQSDYRSKRKPNFIRKKQWDNVYDDLTSAKKDFNSEELKTFERNFYTPHPNVLNRSEAEIENFRKTHDIRLFGYDTDKCPAPIFSFDELNLPPETLNVIRNLNYTEPTPIQSQSWPIALSGLNMVGIGQTGSGKTLGFVLPGMIHMKSQPPLERGEGPLALVLSPTRELTQQTDKVVLPFARSFSFKSACVFGGASKENQISRLQGAHICIGTPGRVIDFLRSDSLNLSRCTYCVLDEADRLLNMGFEPQIRAIMSRMRSDSQILMWSATWPNEVKLLASDFLKEYIGVKFGSAELVANPDVTQIIHVCDMYDKRNLLLRILDEIREQGDGKTLIFASTKSMVFNVYNILRKKGFRVTYLHGDKSQLQRNEALSMFRAGKVQILVGTAVVGRGLDINDIKYVINFDFPTDIEDYIHIIGRTGRCGNAGTAHTLFTHKDARFAKDLIKILSQANQEVNPELKELVANERGFSELRYQSRNAFRRRSP